MTTRWPRLGSWITAALVAGVLAGQARAAQCPDKPVLRALTCKLKDRDPEVRKAAIQALGELGPKALPAVGRLLPQLEQPRYELIEATQDALAKICARAPGRLIRALQHPNVIVQLGVEGALSKIGQASIVRCTIPLEEDLDYSNCQREFCPFSTHHLKSLSIGPPG